MIGIVVITGVEVASLGIWLTLVRGGQPVAGIVVLAVGLVVEHLLAILLIVEHTLSDNVFKDRGLFSRLADGRTIGFSIIEAAGATIWLALVQNNLAAGGIV